MDWNTIRALWWGDVYDQYEDHSDDVALLLSLLGEPKRVLELCCGSGRVAIPLAEAGHDVTGIDHDAGMLARIPAKLRGTTNFTYTLADILTCDWGGGYDAVLLGDNTIGNIDGASDYKKAQEAIVRRAAEALKPGGHFYLVFDMYEDPAATFTSPGGETGYPGPDSPGVTGRFHRCASRYDAKTNTASGNSCLELTLSSGETHLFPEAWSKHVLTLDQALGWLGEAGFEAEHVWNGYDRKPIVENQYNSAVIWARKR